MSGWQALDDQVARWRDDTSAALDRLLAVQRETTVPVALAVVPARATPALAERLAAAPAIDVLQHGYAHSNHALPPDKKNELGPHRPAMLVLGELGTGRMALQRLFATRALPVLVPPWNRIAPALVPALPEIGFAGLSTFAARRREAPVKGLRQINTHVDLIDWKDRRNFVGHDAAVSALVEALRHSRSATSEPVGLLSHHLAMDERAWDFLRSLWGRAIKLPGVKLCSARDLFASGEARV